MIPSINNRFLCITDDFILGALISSYFNKSNEYFVLLEPPRMKRPDFSNEIIRIMNIIFKIRPEKVILCNLKDEESEPFKKRINTKRILEINENTDLNNLEKIINFSFLGEVICKENDILFGLLSAKLEKKRLLVRNTGKRIDYNKLDKYDFKRILIIEETNSITDVIGINYAFATNSLISIIPSSSRKEVSDLERKIKKIDDDRIRGIEYEDRLEEIKYFIFKKIKKINFNGYKSATFITKGIPYNLALDNLLPVSHMLEFGLGKFIFENIYYESANSFFQNILIFSPELFESEEIESTISIFSEKNFHIKALKGEEASFDNLEKYFPFYPYDLLHICTHGGEFDGFKVIEKFLDRCGNEHILEYEQVLAHSNTPINGEKVMVWSVEFYKKLDGYKWGSNDVKENIPKYVFDDLQKMLVENINRIELEREEIDTKINGSFGIVCYDNNFHPTAFHVIANHNNPVIFNNICLSWYTIGSNFIFAGARTYIGTIFSIDNNLAINFANTFYSGIFSKTLLDSFWESSKQHNTSFYIFYGTHFSKLKYNPEFSRDRMIKHIYNSIDGLKKKLIYARNKGVRSNILRWIIFLEKILYNDL